MFSLKKCLNCRHKFLSKFPTETNLQELYKSNSKYVFGHESDEEYEKNRFKDEGFKSVLPFNDHWIFNFIDINQPSKYFEIGPGLCRLYKTFYEKKWHCEGLDLQPFIKAPGIIDDLKKIKDNSKDVAVALDVIEHTINPNKFLKEINNKLKIDGKIFLSFPNSDSFKSKILNNKWGMIVPLAHLNFFSKKSIKVSLENNNFKVIYLKNYSLASPKRFTKNLIKLPFRLLKDLIFLNQSQNLKEEDENSFFRLHPAGDIAEDMPEVFQQEFFSMLLNNYSEKEIAMMKNGAGIVNASRGGVVDEVALVQALNSGKLAFACLDTFENEPTPAVQVLMQPNVSLTPHIGAATLEAQDRIGEELAQQIVAILKASH